MGEARRRRRRRRGGGVAVTFLQTTESRSGETTTTPCRTRVSPRFRVYGLVFGVWWLVFDVCCLVSRIQGSAFHGRSFRVADARALDASVRYSLGIDPPHGIACGSTPRTTENNLTRKLSRPP